MESEPRYCCHVCVCGQAVVFPASPGLGFNVYFTVSFVSCLKIGETSVLPLAFLP